MAAGRRGAPAVVPVLLLLVTGCGADVRTPSAGAPRPAAPTSSTPSPPRPSEPGPDPAPRPAAEPPVGRPARPAVEPSDGRPRPARMSIPALGLRDVPVRPYRGTTDDAAGTAIQDGGALASPHGPRGGVGPGGVGNYLVTGHRTSSTAPFADLPQLRRRSRVLVEVGATTFVYEVRRTRSTSFRRPASLRAQRAAVPGHPGVAPTRAMLTLSTCATPEDRAAGNLWSDEHGNPEHRIDKVAVLVARRGS